MGVVGVGSWGKNIVRALKELENEDLVKLIGVADINTELAASVAKTYNVGSYGRTVKDLVQLGVEAVAVSVPLDKLFPVAREALSLGVHSFIEKPVSTKPDEVNKLMNIAEGSSLIAQPGFIVRYDPVARTVKELMKGRPKSLIFKRFSARPTHRMMYSIMLDLMIHDIDLALSFVKPQEVDVLSAVGFKEVFGTPQEVHATLLLNGIPTYLITDGMLPAKVRVVEITTEEAYYEASFTDSTVLIKDRSSTNIRRVSGEEPLKTELRDFIRAIEGIKPAEAPSLQDALKCLLVIESINEKLRIVSSSRLSS